MITGCSSLIGTRIFLLLCVAAAAVPSVWAGAVDGPDCGTAGGEVMTEWQFPIGAFAPVAPWSAGVGVGAGVLCSCAAVGFCALWSASAWLVTSGAVTNK